MAETTDTRVADPGLHLLADHLNAILRMGDDLAACICPACGQAGRIEPAEGEERSGSGLASLSLFIAQVRRIEMAIVARILQARRRADELPASDPVMRPLVRLFFSSTVAVTDWAIEEAGKPAHRLDAGGLPVAFLRSRGLIGPEAAAPDPYVDIEIGPDYLLCGIAPLGQLLDLVETMLDAIDARIGMFAPREQAAVRAAS